MIRKICSWFLPIWIAACATAVCWGQKLPPPIRRDDQPVEAPKGAPDVAKPMTAGVGLAVDPAAYRIGGEDVLRIETWRHPEFSFVMAVRPDGKISIPLVGEMVAGGLTPDEFSKKFSTSIADYVKNPEVFVVVLEVRSKKFYIDGEVGKPGEVPLIGPTRVFEALSKAGGFREFANRKKIKVVRGSQVFKFNWDEVAKGKKLEQNILIENGDHIVVP